MSSPGECRALRVDNKKWAKGWYFYQSGKSYILEPCGPAKMPDYQLCFIGKDSIIEVIPETVGQSTGLKDKNGVDGYFGDIAKHTDGYCGVLKWNEKTLRVYFQWNDGQISYPQYIGAADFVFIGNIHTTPERLEAH